MITAKQIEEHENSIDGVTYQKLAKSTPFSLKPDES